MPLMDGESDEDTVVATADSNNTGRRPIDEPLSFPLITAAKGSRP